MNAAEQQGSSWQSVSLFGLVLIGSCWFQFFQGVQSWVSSDCDTSELVLNCLRLAERPTATDCSVPRLEDDCACFVCLPLSRPWDKPSSQVRRSSSTWRDLRTLFPLARNTSRSESGDLPFARLTCFKIPMACASYVIRKHTHTHTRAQYRLMHFSHARCETWETCCMHNVLVVKYWRKECFHIVSSYLNRGDVVFRFLWGQNGQITHKSARQTCNHQLSVR